MMPWMPTARTAVGRTLGTEEWEVCLRARLREGQVEGEWKSLRES